MFCENCGAELQDPDQKFCPNCGIPLRVKIFKYSDLKKEFKEGKMKKPLFEILNPDYILIFVDTTQKRVWIWYGSNTTTRMKFIAAKLAPAIRDRYGIDYKIAAVDEGNEILGFKRMIGLEEESDYTEAQTGTIFERTEQDLELLESLSREKILLLLEKINKGDNSIKEFEINGIRFDYSKVKKKYLGSEITEQSLNPQEEESNQELNCKFCGNKLVKEQKICPVCGKMVI